ncbi:MAG TPA: hypothetical protein OIM30_08955 [Oscillospiraceae bacterium]|nr:hypothetical protein [Oscillospiraceae bacterium]
MSKQKANRARRPIGFFLFWQYAIYAGIVGHWRTRVLIFLTVRTKLAVDAATAAKSSGRRNFSGAKAKAATCKLPDKQVKNAETLLISAPPFDPQGFAISGLPAA